MMIHSKKVAEISCVGTAHILCTTRGVELVVGTCRPARRILLKSGKLRERSLNFAMQTWSANWFSSKTDNWGSWAAFKISKLWLSKAQNQINSVGNVHPPENVSHARSTFALLLNAWSITSWITPLPEFIRFSASPRNHLLIWMEFHSFTPYRCLGTVWLSYFMNPYDHIFRLAAKMHSSYWRSSASHLKEGLVIVGTRWVSSRLAKKAIT